jgi:hypothetical protein
LAKAVKADCTPIIFFDPVKESLGFVHTGWKAADMNIVSKANKRLSNLFGTKPKNLIVGIGPSARKDSFIKENPSQKDDPKWKGFIENVDGERFKVDFVGLGRKQLIEAGVLEKNIFDCEIDTFSEERFFSHARDGKLPINKQGRFACVVGLK